MSAIFSSALSGIKNNPNPTKSSFQASESNGTSSGRGSASKLKSDRSDIFSRLKQNESKKVARLVNDKIHSRHEKDYNVNKVHRKTISKDLLNRLGRKPTKSDSNEGVWGHDLYQDGPALVENTAAATIFIRNLPDSTDSNLIKSLLKDTSSIVGHSVLN